VRAAKGLPIDIRALESAVKAAAREAQALYSRPVRTWQHKVYFKVRKLDWHTYQTSTRDKIFRFVEKGTRPHIIRAKNAPTLAFNTQGFKPKTAIKSLDARRGHAAGPPMAFPLAVQHPGTEARDFTSVIAPKVRKFLVRATRRAFRNTIKVK
jgi:hypothetical protein